MIWPERKDIVKHSHRLPPLLDDANIVENISDEEINKMLESDFPKGTLEKIKKDFATTDTEIDEAYGAGSVEKEFKRLKNLKDKSDSQGNNTISNLTINK